MTKHNNPYRNAIVRGDAASLLAGLRRAAEVKRTEAQYMGEWGRGAWVAANNRHSSISHIAHQYHLSRRTIHA